MSSMRSLFYGKRSAAMHLALFLTWVPPLCSQSLNPAAPAVEYIRIGPRIIAREMAISSTGTITPGGPPVTINIARAWQEYVLDFNGAAGQRVSLRITASTLNSVVSIAADDGIVLGSANVTSSTGFIDVLSLPATGKYHVTVVPNNANLGGMTLTLYNVVDLTGTIVPSGPAVPLTLTTPGQRALYTFSASAGDRVSLRATNANIYSGHTTINSPTGVVVGSALIAGTGFFMDTVTLPDSGTYTMIVDPDAAYTGNITLNLYAVPPDVTGPIGIDGSAVIVTIAAPGQNAALTFSGTAGQRVSVKVSNSTITQSTLALKAPDGTTIGSISPGTFMEPQVLPVAGTYTLSLNPYIYYTGSMTLNLYNVPPDLTGMIQIGGPAVDVTMAAPGQNAYLTFSGAAGQRVSLRFTNVTYQNGVIKILKPDGSQLTTYNMVFNGVNFIDTQQLPMAGTYTISIDPNIYYTGTATFTLYDVPLDVTSDIAIGGATVPVTITTPGQNGVFPFACAAGQTVTIRVTDSTIPGAALKLRRPDGTTQYTLQVVPGNMNSPQQTMSQTGTCSLFFDPTYYYVGSLNITLTN